MKADIQGELFDFSETREEMPGMLIYRHDASGVKLNVRLEGETVWLSQQQMADLYQTSKRNIAVHIKNMIVVSARSRPLALMGWSCSSCRQMGKWSAHFTMWML